MVLVDPVGDQVKYIVRFEFKATNNMAEYEALIFGLMAAQSLGIKQLLVKGDSQLVIRQVRGECCCNNPQPSPWVPSPCQQGWSPQCWRSRSERRQC